MTCTRLTPRSRSCDILGRQVASPVQWVHGLETLYATGVSVFVEVGPKKALHGFVDDVLGSTHEEVSTVHQPPQERRCPLTQRRAVRAMGQRPRLCARAGRKRSGGTPGGAARERRHARHRRGAHGARRYPEDHHEPDCLPPHEH